MIASFVSDIAGLLFTIGSFIVALGVIVAVHEYGHYIIGRWTGIKAEVFSLGFGPVLGSRIDRHGTRWQVAAIPLGGFVRFKGDLDAASAQAGGTAGLDAAQLRQTMAGAPLWARTLTVAAGPVFNFILAFVIFVGLIVASGIISDRAVVGAIYPMPTPQGLQVGDEVVAVSGAPTLTIESYYEVAQKIEPVSEVQYTVVRAGQTLDVTAPHPLPARTKFVHLRSAAFDAGIREGDVVVQINDQKIYAFSQMPPLVEASGGAAVDVQIWRPEVGDLTVSLTPNRRDLPIARGGFETRWLMGLSSDTLFEPERRNAGLLEAAQIAVGQIVAVFNGTFSGIAHMVRGDISTCNISGPVGLADTMGDAARTGIESFITMLAMVSLGVGILNLLPVPVLDGGHLVFFAVEAITRRKPSPRLVNAAAMLGLFLVAALTIFALNNDLTCV